MQKKKQKSEIAIIGAGASGLACAIFCAKSGVKVHLYEQNFKCAKKVLVSGNGRCNITNKNISSKNYNTQNHQFVEEILKKFGFIEFEHFINSQGVLLDVKNDGKVYPLSYEAKSVVRVLENSARELGVVFHIETKIEKIRELYEEYSAVVVATGSEAASHLGGNSDGLEFAKEFGHNIIPTYPSLVQLHLNSKFASKMSGTKVSGEVTLLINGKKEKTAKGDILFTNYGVSGFAILDISHDASLALMEYSAVDISLNLLPTFNAQKLSSHLLATAKRIPNLTLLDILIGIIPLKIAQTLLDRVEISHSFLAKELHTKLAKKVANQLLNWRFEVTQTHGFRHAEVSGGGVDTLEIDLKTMQSYRAKNLYFIGEVLDVVGERGGYNFAFAWASAYICSQNIIKNLESQ